MQIQRIGYRVRGLYRLAGIGLKWGMIAPGAEKRLKILSLRARESEALARSPG